MCNRYSKETKTEIINLSNTIGVTEAAKRLSLPIKTIANLRHRNPELAIPLPAGGKRTKASPKPETNFMGQSVVFAPAKPKREKTGVVMEEVVRTVVREKRNQYTEDERREALILADMIGTAKAAEELQINAGTLNMWKAKRAGKIRKAEEKRKEDEKLSFLESTVVKLTQEVSTLKSVLKSKLGIEKLA